MGKESIGYVQDQQNVFVKTKSISQKQCQLVYDFKVISYKF